MAHRRCVNGLAEQSADPLTAARTVSTKSLMAKRRNTIESESKSDELDKLVQENEEKLPPEKKESLSRYRDEHRRRLKELYYERSNGFRPPRPWYEE